MTTRDNTLAHTPNVVDNVHVDNVHFEGDKIPFLRSFHKLNFTLIVISYEIK